MCFSYNPWNYIFNFNYLLLIQCSFPQWYRIFSSGTALNVSIILVTDTYFFFSHQRKPGYCLFKLKILNICPFRTVFEVAHDWNVDKHWENHECMFHIVDKTLFSF